MFDTSHSTRHALDAQCGQTHTIRVANPSPPEASVEIGSVLVVEDDEELSILLRAVLEELGYRAPLAGPVSGWLKAIRRGGLGLYDFRGLQTPRIAHLLERLEDAVTEPPLTSRRASDRRGLGRHCSLKRKRLLPPPATSINSAIWRNDDLRRRSVGRRRLDDSGDRPPKVPSSRRASVILGTQDLAGSVRAMQGSGGASRRVRIAEVVRLTHFTHWLRRVKRSVRGLALSLSHIARVTSSTDRQKNFAKRRRTHRGRGGFR